jgi:hypothetical protein
VRTDLCLKIKPGKVVKPEIFRRMGPRSIALDGFCWGPTWFDNERLVGNINHHEGCDRLATRASCLQALILLKMGLRETLSCGERLCVTLYANDCDQDVAFASYAFMHAEHLDRPMLRGLIELEDRLDSTAGLYPVKKRWHHLQKLLWITEPYTEARVGGELNGMSGAQMVEVVERIHRRITKTLHGRGKEIAPDTAYELLEDFGGWQYVREIGQHARFRFGQDGILAFVSSGGETSGGHQDTVGRRSPLVSGFPLPAICAALNRAEGLAEDSERCWGGNTDNIIGSPRGTGSSLAPRHVLRIVRDCVAERQAKHAARRR